MIFLCQVVRLVWIDLFLVGVSKKIDKPIKPRKPGKKNQKNRTEKKTELTD
jgi:hypothetical protein